MEGSEALASLYSAYKPLLFALSYRMLGSVADAEDVVQEAFLDYEAASSRQEIMHKKAYLCKIATHRCLDRLRSASRQREVYIGPWLPEPLLTEGFSSETTRGAAAEPFERYLQKESLSTAYMLLLQQLSDVERAVFILREVLQYEYDEIAEIVGKTAANCRQIFHRAKRAVISTGSTEAAGEVALAAARRRADPVNRITERFVEALASGNMEALLGLITQHVVLSSDGGGKVTAAVRPILGADRVSQFLLGIMKKISQEAFSYRLAEVNGSTGIVTKLDGETNSVFTFGLEGDLISSIYIMVNPDKLQLVE